VPPERELGTRLDFPAVRAATLGIWSSGDNYLLEEPVRRSGEHVTGEWRHERIESASHWMQLDASGRINELLLDFLA
jgi:pimeloyl-ACP methyl ester carboxylesterase